MHGIVTENAEAIEPLLQNLLEVLNQRGKILRQGVPHQVQVNIEIGVNQAVSHIHNVMPRNLVVLFSRLGPNTGCCLANDLNTLEQAQR